MNWRDAVGDLMSKVNSIRMAKGAPALKINANLCRAATLRCWRWQAGEDDARGALQLAQDCWYSGDAAYELDGAGQHDLLDYIPDWEQAPFLNAIVDPQYNEIGAGCGGSPLGLFACVILGHRASAPMAETTGAELPACLPEAEFSVYGAQFGTGKLQF